MTDPCLFLAAAIMHREKLPRLGLTASGTGMGGFQGGGPVRCVRGLLRDVFFSVAKQITVQVATQRAVNAPLPTAIQE